MLNKVLTQLSFVTFCISLILTQFIFKPFKLLKSIVWLPEGISEKNNLFSYTE